ncbi:MAG: hypothetical protein KatS3mg078_1602 [Deltaproteobacteria bacterium]|nr:MAG: hypothetical protein KatS3mg078_1602 [Deltaproteobacteria bacterium]
MKTADRFVFLNPPGVAEVAVVLILLLILIYSFLKLFRYQVSGFKKTVLVFLNLLSFLFLLVILFDFAVVTEIYEEERPHVAILLDGSWSMNLPADTGDNSRAQYVRDFFKKHRDFFSELESRSAVSYFVFDEGLYPVSPELIDEFKPYGRCTSIAKALLELERRPQRIDSVILFSDGASNCGSLSEDKDSLLKGAFNTKVNTVGTVLLDDVKDIWVDAVRVSDIAFVRYPLSLNVVIRSIGIGSITVPVTLSEGNRILAVKYVSLDSSNPLGVEVGFEVRPDSVGRKVYTVSVPVISGELIKENNSSSFVVEAIIDRIRVLHIAGSPSWDVRFLRRALKRNPSVNLVAFFILREATDIVFASQNELSLIPFPVDEIFDKGLKDFDVVIFQNFDFRPYGIYGYHLKKLRDYVAKDGGGFVLIGGESGFFRGYETEPVSDLIPVKVDGLFQEKVTRDGSKVRLTEVGRKHPVTRILVNEEENQKQWERLPSLDTLSRVEGLKPDALSLVETSQGDPVLVLSKVGSGKVATFLSDSLWKWSFVHGGEGDLYPYYESLWNRLLLWMVGDPSLKDLRVKTDRGVYNPGEYAKIEVWEQAYDEADSKPVAYVTRPDGSTLEVELAKGGEGRFESEVKVYGYGVYRVRVQGNSEPGSDRVDETLFIVSPPVKEIRGPNVDIGLLREISKKTGGRFITIKDNPKELGISLKPKRVITGSREVRIWDSPWVFICLVLLVSSEWVLRRTWGLK